jgi:F-type H+-transporting ATPase subunit b
MDEILYKLGGLFLGSVPTIILFLLIVALYNVLVYRPLMRVLRERRARTIGAVTQANLAIAEAEAKAQEYEAKLRAARKSIFEAREQRLRQWNNERESALSDARESALRTVTAAKASLNEEVEAAHQGLEKKAEELAREILKTILPEEPEQELASAGGVR